jgi:hypothetical protein
MTLVQIYTIIALLISFNVPPAVVSQVQEALQPAVSTELVSESALPSEPPQSVIIDNSTIAPKDLHGTVDFWADLLVRQNDMPEGTAVTCSVDGTLVASSNGASDDYLLPVDTTKYANGTYEVSIVATDSNGNTASKTLEAGIEN